MIAGRYQLTREVGRGGMGSVWLGTDTVLGRSVALKQLQSVSSGGATATRAAREARLAARLSHRNVVAVFDLVEDAGQHWLVMEFVDGTNLRQLVGDQGPLSPDRAASILGPVAGGLQAAHDAGVIHRDVKPSNILVAANGTVKLTDFGIARGTTSDHTVTQPGFVTGSPAYLSPEVAMGESATPASDVWSLGSTLFFAVTGRTPYDVGDNVFAAMYRIVHEDPPRTELAGWLTPVLAGAMTRDPAQRWSMAQVHAFLRAGPDADATRQFTTVAPVVRGAAAGPSGPPPGRPHRPAPTIAPEPSARRARRWLLPALVVLLIVAAAGAGLVIGLRGAGSPSAQNAASVESPEESATAEETPETTEDVPTEDGMNTFVTDYLNTAAADPNASFAMLTPEFQAASGGIEGYSGFWGAVASIDQIHWIDANPDDLRVSYSYSYTMDDGSTHTEDVTLQLAYTDGAYLIAGQ